MSSRRNRSSSEAELIFETAFENGLLESKWQRFSITNGFHVRGLRSKPIWDVSETGKLEVSICLDSDRRAVLGFDLPQVMAKIWRS